MSDGSQLWGWLDQDGRDPLEGKAAAQTYLCNMLGLRKLEDTPPALFDPSRVAPSRLSQKVRKSLVKKFGSGGFTEDAFQRKNLSLGQSYPDQLKRRSDVITGIADAIVRPASAEEAVALLQFASAHGFSVTPVGGASNVVGAFDIKTSKRPRVLADMSSLSQIIAISGDDLIVTAGSGMRLPELEAALNARGLTLGHFPQSFHAATLAGSIACNGAGQRSDGYGRLCDNLVAATLATPRGLWTTEPFRHAAEGPWLGGLIAGSEGLLGLICTATMKVRKVPEIIEDRAWFVRDFRTACDAIQRVAQDRHGLAMLRVSDENESGFLSGFRLALAGRSRAPLMERAVLAMKRAPERPALVIAGYEGSRMGRDGAFRHIGSELRKAAAIPLGTRPGASWRKGRYELPYLRESLLQRGLGVDTFETFVPWTQLHQMHKAVCDALREIVASTLGASEGRAAVMCHLSHSYPDGACLYFTLVFPREENALQQWRVIKSTAMAAIAENGGAASHHHGAGADHADLAGAHKGELGLSALRALKASLDPDGVLVSGIGRMLDGSKEG